MDQPLDRRRRMLACQIPDFARYTDATAWISGPSFNETFKLQDPSGCSAVNIFTWGHPALSNGDQVRVDGVFETEHHQGRYTFHNEVEATKVTSVPR